MGRSSSAKKSAIAKGVKSGRSIMTNPDDKIVDNTFSIGVHIKNAWEVVSTTIQSILSVELSNVDPRKSVQIYASPFKLL